MRTLEALMKDRKRRIRDRFMALRSRNPPNATVSALEAYRQGLRDGFLEGLDLGVDLGRDTTLTISTQVFQPAMQILA